MIQTVDTDVLIIATGAFHQLTVECVAELWIAFGTGKSFRFFAVHDMAVSLGPEKANVLPVFHAFPRCDQTLFLLVKGKLQHGEYRMASMMSLQLLLP